MDNAYYTGATLIRAGNHGGGSSKYLNPSSPPLTPCQINVSTSLAGPPLLLQPNLLTGLPLIRNGQHGGNNNHQHHQSLSNVPASPGHNGGIVGNSGPGPPPGVICCFQPVYYIPTNNAPTVYPNQQLLVNNGGVRGGGNGNSNIKLNPAPKRRSYKNVPTATSGGHHKLNRTPPPLPDVSYNNHPKLTASSSYPDPISPPGKQAKIIHKPITRAFSSNYFLTGPNIGESMGSDYNEEKEKSENLLNYYFYDKHWRPKDESDNSDTLDSNDLDSDHGWHNASTQLKSFTEILHLDNDSDGDNSSRIDMDSTSSPQRISESNTPESLSPTSSTYGQQKDLEVEAQIITLANGHRDLEIRLCYVTS